MALYVTQRSKFHIFLVDYLLETSEDFLTGHEKLKTQAAGAAEQQAGGRGSPPADPVLAHADWVAQVAALKLYGL